jgi:regulator of chromosome condensation
MDGFPHAWAGRLQMSCMFYTQKTCALIPPMLKYNSSSPANVPGLVTDLMELPTGKITKIAAGGYLVMALTEGNDLYAWGGHPGVLAMFDGLSESPTPVDVEDNDVVDFSVGSSHACLLSKDGHLFTVGDNTNGQLGLPGEKRLHSWTKIPHVLSPRKTITSVICGPRNTLFVASSKDTQAAS